MNQQINRVWGDNELKRMNCGIVTSEGDLDQCMKAHKIVYIVLKLCIDIEVKLGLFGAWDGY